MAKLTFKYVPPGDLPGVRAVPAPEVARSTDSREGPCERAFHESSWDLRRGLQVSEGARDDIPSELFDELFGS